ncbi:hypothetical protein H4W80_008441 [Nonomuraea angiospora]|uniref:Uncharacterized protein n=1 Tax=Nonomuraea angiospora TaxID=46172 RepID=A0ABR9MB92_9ACTN|nr:hypothetical protein [Nonomuraea angiospora]
MATGKILAADIYRGKIMVRSFRECDGAVEGQERTSLTSYSDIPLI